MNNTVINYLSIIWLFLSACLSLQAGNPDKAVSNLRHQVLDNPQEKLYLHLNKPKYMAGDTIWLRGHTASEAFHLPSALSRGIVVSLSGPDGKVLERFSLLPLDKRLYSTFIPLPDYLPQGTYTLKAYSERMAGKRSHAYCIKDIQVANPVRIYQPENRTTEQHLDVHFYPEGGSLLEGQYIDVVFTAKDQRGRLLNVKGEVYDNNGEQVTQIQTFEPGIGRFSIPVGIGNSYFTLIRDEAGKTHHFDFPPVKNKGFGLKVTDMGSAWYVSAIQAGSDKLTEPLNVLLLLRGVPNYEFELTPDKEYEYIPKDSLKSGVYQLVLLDGQNNVASERLLFANNDDQSFVNWELMEQSDSIADKSSHSIDIDLTVSDAEGKPVLAEFSISAYPKDSLATNPPKLIATDFLLTSDLNQILPDPDRFMRQKDAASMLMLDTWLIASKWPKFDIKRAIDGLLESSWDIGETDDLTERADNTGYYSPLTAEEMAAKNQILYNITLKEVNVTAEQLDKQIKPYTYANHTISGKDLVEQGSTIQDYLSTLPGANWDYTAEVLSIRGGSVTYLLDGIMTDASVLNTTPATEIESVDVLKDPANMALLKFSTDDTTMTAIGGVVAIWTKTAYDIKPKKPKRFIPPGEVISDDVRRVMVPGTENTWLSQFPNISGSNLWKPCVLTDEQGKATICLVPKREDGPLVLELNGIAADGSLISQIITLDLPVPKP